MAINKFIQVRISENTEIGQFNDAIYYTEDEFNKLSEDDINVSIKERVDNWVAFVKEQSSKEPVPPTVEDLQQQADAIKEQWNRMIAQLAEVGSQEDVQAAADLLNDVVATTDAAVQATPIKEKPPGDVVIGG